MTGQHEPLWKPEVKSGDPEGQAFPAPHAAPVMMFLCRIKERNAPTTTISWSTDITSHVGHWDTIRECQMTATTKKPSKCWYQPSFYETLTEKPPCQQNRPMQKSRQESQALEYRINCDMQTLYAGDDGMSPSRNGQLTTGKPKSSRLS